MFGGIGGVRYRRDPSSGTLGGSGALGLAGLLLFLLLGGLYTCNSFRAPSGRDPIVSEWTLVRGPSNIEDASLIFHDDGEFLARGRFATDGAEHHPFTIRGDWTARQQSGAGMLDNGRGAYDITIDSFEANPIEPLLELLGDDLTPSVNRARLIRFLGMDFERHR